MAEADTNSYNSPYYADLNAQASQRNGIPPGLLHAVVTRGERSNADQVSSAGAQTVYQITPTTRDLALKKWGIDAYLNPENAADVAAKLLKDSLDRNQGAAPLAVAEYIGGTDPKNWGPETRAYVRRVTGTPLANGQDVKQSTYDKVMAARNADATPSIARVVAAYKAGRMEPEDKAAFEADVAAGKVLLPRGVTIDAPAGVRPAAPTAAKDGTPLAPQSVIDAYQTGTMTPAESHEFETDVAEKRVAVPEGTQIAQPSGLVTRLAEGAAETISGAKRGTDTTAKLPDWLGMPELSSMSTASLKAAAGTLFAGPDEAVKVIQAQYPKTVVRQDEKGNYVLKSSLDGQEYAIKPGLQWGDVPRILAGVAAFTPAGRATTIIGAGLKSAATETAIQASQAATGGTFDPADVALAAAGGAGGTALAKGAGAVIEAAKPAVVAGVDALKSRLPGAAARAEAEASGAGIVGPDGQPIAAAAPGMPPPAAAEVIPPNNQPAKPIAPGMTVPPEAPPAAAVPPVTPEAPPVTPAAAMTPEELAATTRKASQGGIGSGKAMEKLAAETAPDAPTVKAMNELGFEYQPDHVTSNSAYRELAQILKSVPGSETKAAEVQMLAHNAEKADAIIEKLGGTHDLSELSHDTLGTMNGIYAALKTSARALYKKIEDAIPATTPAAAPDVLALIAKRAEQLGGAEFLTPGEKKILEQLTPKAVESGPAIDALVRNGHISAADYAAAVGAGKPVMKQPTYALLDQVRKDIGEAKRGASETFGTRDAKILGDLEAALRTDQGRVAEAAGVGSTWQAANGVVRMYKGVQNDLETLFGKQLEKSLVNNLSLAVKKLSAGDTSNFVKMISAIPKNLRPDVVASGLSTAFGKSATRGEINFGSYAKWYEGLQRNTIARDALFSNLPPDAVKQLGNLYKAAKGISLSTAKYSTTGKSLYALEIMKADSLMSRVFDVAKKTGAAEAVTTAIGLPGAGTAAAIASALMRNKPSAMRAADALINSPEFIAAARAGTKQNIARLAHSKAFGRFVRAAGDPRELKDREKWIAQALQAKKEQKK